MPIQLVSQIGDNEIIKTLQEIPHHLNHQKALLKNSGRHNKKDMPAEIIKEFRVIVQDLEHSVKGRIVKSVKGDFKNVFLGEFSHHCKPHVDAIDVYSPDIVRQDYNSAERLVLSYLENFTTIDVKPNQYY